MNEALFNKLIDPIQGDELCGQDLSYSSEFDEIREARREDDASLTQGEWETELKVPQWAKVKQVCEEILQYKSKDLQVACWYTEALTKLHGFAGLTFGLQVLEVLITDFWEFFYPPFVDADLDERAGKIAWLNAQLALTVRQIPITDQSSGAYSWFKWSESRETENLGMKSAEAKVIAIANGKLCGEAFDKAANASGVRFYQSLYAQSQAAALAVASIEKHVDVRFEKDSPGLKELRRAVADCADVAEKLLVKMGGRKEKANPQSSPKLADGLRSRSLSSANTGLNQTAAAGEICSRNDAIAALRQVSLYFKTNEPHSPVALLADRAAKWAEMPLEGWLESVIKDHATLTQLRELLDITRD